MTEILELMAATHPDATIAEQLRQDLADETERELQVGRDALATLRQIACLARGAGADLKKRELLELLEAIEILVDEADYL